MEVLKVALPVPSKVTGEPALLPSITNWTVPVGIPVPGAFAATVAVKVTFCPRADGFCDEVTVVVLLSLLTTWLTVPLLPV